ncbi:MAG: beta-galactosidase [Candidatus Parcubacteria bacterium]|nr:beta-galactosidase [Candidatus Parcubacteria bacterium]
MYYILIAIVLFLGVFLVLAQLTYQPQKPIKYGVTFSKEFASYLGLDWQKAYSDMLDELQVKYLRLPVYWDQLEPQKDQYDFSAADWQIGEAAKRNVKIILVVGRRQPRWPECHDPAWVNSVSSKEAREKLLKNIELVVNRYKNNSAIEIWQVENEPFLNFFGKCPKMSKQELQEEIDLVRKLDNRKILLTDSGELSTWYPLSKMGDYFGTTLYRTTYNKYFGYWNYFFVPASFYRLKALALGNSLDNTMIAELQAEPWFSDGVTATPLEKQLKGMNADKLKANAEYARKTNFSRAYFWGVEWWYWLKVNHNNPSVWDAAKEYFK